MRHEFHECGSLDSTPASVTFSTFLFAFDFKAFIPVQKRRNFTAWIAAESWVEEGKLSSFHFWMLKCVVT